MTRWVIAAFLALNGCATNGVRPAFKWLDEETAAVGVKPAPDGLVAKRDCIEFCTAATERVNIVLKRYGFKLLTPVSDESSFRYEAMSTREKVAMLRTGNEKAEFQFLAESGDLWTFGSYRGSEGYDPKKSRPAWPKAKVEEFSREFIGALLERFPPNLRFEKAEWKNRRLPGHASGEWSVTWRRIDRHGHRFQNSTVTMALTEENGPELITVELGELFEEDNFRPLSRSVAIEKAKIVGKVSKDGWIGTHRLAGVPRAALKIVTLPKTWVLKPRERRLRLAWVVEFRMVYASRAMEAEKDLPRHENGVIEIDALDRNFDVWIDAENGEMLWIRF